MPESESFPCPIYEDDECKCTLFLANMPPIASIRIFEDGLLQSNCMSKIVDISVLTGYMKASQIVKVLQFFGEKYPILTFLRYI